MDFESNKQTLTLDEIKKTIDNTSASIEDEIQRTGQSWFACFATTAWKVIPTLLDTARRKGEISDEQERSAQEKIRIALGKVREYEQQSGKPTHFEEGVPSEEIKQELLGMLKAIV